MQKLKLLSLTNAIHEYRIPVYNLLSEKYDLTVAHYGDLVDKELVKFNQLKLTPRKLGPLMLFEESIVKICRCFDVVISGSELRWPQLWGLGLLPNRKFALIFWNIGVSASYKKKFDEDRRLDFLRFRIMNRADAIVFYSNYPVSRYISTGYVNPNKLFVANNTVDVTCRHEIYEKKKYFLFVGTLYKEKKIFDLLRAYKILCERNETVQPLLIVGDGTERTSIESWLFNYGLEKKVTLMGAIFDNDELIEIYANAIALISPGQAGLSVLSAFAHGVPFITRFDAITGGEFFNIKNDVNGAIYSGDINELCDILEKLSTEESWVYRLSRNAQDYYFKERTLDIMVNGLIESIEFSMKTKCENNL